MAQLEVDLVAADHKVWSGSAKFVAAPAADGEVGILPGHSPLLSVLRPGTVRIDPVEGSPVHVHVDGGFLSMDHDHVTVVADAAKMVSPPGAR